MVTTKHNKNRELDGIKWKYRRMRGAVRHPLAANRNGKVNSEQICVGRIEYEYVNGPYIVWWSGTGHCRTRLYMYSSYTAINIYFPVDEMEW